MVTREARKIQDLIAQATVSIKRTRRLLRDADRALGQAQSHLSNAVWLHGWELQHAKEMAHRRLAVQRMLEEVQETE